MKKAWMLAIIPGMLAIMVGIFIVVLLLLKLLWAWTVPDLFPGAVSQGLVAGTISWYTAFKVAIFIAVLAGVAGARRQRHEHIESVVVKKQV
ncbi:MAG: hypothetical protein HW405_207 [Candidatus Berkelbacteria bacterium]|nr:hypothetical protein [Candidatus Berkelbacteria bacterium]